MTCGPDENPWLSISAEDYEEHMGDTGAKQLAFLSQAFKSLLDGFRPESVAVLGCATGNGFDQIDRDVTTLLVGVDVNPDFLAVARDRYGESLPGLQLFRSDINNIELAPRSLDLVFCGLFLEHTDPQLVIAKSFRWLRPGGIFGTVLQLPSNSGRTVSDTGIESIKKLESSTKLVDPETLTRFAEKAGLQLLSENESTLETGKSFRSLTYKLNS